MENTKKNAVIIIVVIGLLLLSFMTWLHWHSIAESQSTLHAYPITLYPNGSGTSSIAEFVDKTRIENASPARGTTTRNMTPPVPLTIDAEFEIQEANVSIVNYINSTPISSEQLQKYPELERHLQGVNNDAEDWVQGWRLVADFPGNLSQYNVFVCEVCKGKTRIECNGGMLFEYHDRFYKVYYQQYGTISRNPNS